jgi:DNA mismatch repair protein MutS2
MVEVERAARIAIKEAVEELRQEASRRLSELEARQDSAPRSARSRADDRARWSGTIGSLEGAAMRDLRDRLAAEAASVTEETPAAAATPRGSARAARGAPARKKPGAAKSPSDPSSGPLRRGDLVSVAPFDLHGTVLREWSGEEDTPVEVDIGATRLRPPRQQLAPSAARPRRGRRSPHAPSPGVGTSYRTRRDLLPEVDLHGMTVERALEVVDKYIDDAMLAEFSSVRLIHGYGTLRLRDAIHRWLAGRPGIASYASAGAGDGGAGVTVVRLKE